jgi:hypothetical protein
MKKTNPILILPFLFFIQAKSNPGDSVIPKKKYFTKRASSIITIDGIPNEDVWNTVEWGGDFIQWQPHDGIAPSQQTNFKILYDDKFLYVGYQCHDLAPDSIIRRMGRRDAFPVIG